MIIKGDEGRLAYGEAIGILSLDFYAPHIPGDVTNASTYAFPVRYEPVIGLTFDKLLNRDKSVFDILLASAKRLRSFGVKAITADCGFFALFQEDLASEMDVPVFLSSLLQVPFMNSIIGKDGKVGIVSAVGENLNDKAFLSSLGIEYDKVRIKGLEHGTHFPGFGVHEDGILNVEGVRDEVVQAAVEHIQEDPSVRAILLECSMIPPYGKAVSDAVNVPVFDFITMTNYVYSTLVKKEYTGFM